MKPSEHGTLVTETARADNLALSEAARHIVQALSQMRTQGWIDDATAIQLAFKFAGEPIPQEEIERILKIHGEQSEATPALDRSQEPASDEPEA